MEEMDNEMFGETIAKKAGPSIMDHVKKYLAYWPVFILSLGIFIGGAMLYLRKATPKYIATTMILVKGESKGSTQQDLISNALVAKRGSNLENELLLMRSSDLMERIVLENQFNISYYILGRVKTTDIYQDAPFRLIVQKVVDSSQGFSFVVKNLSNTGVTIEYGSKKNVRVIPLKWNAPYSIGGHQFVLAPRGKHITGDGEFMAVWSPVKQTAGEIMSKYTVDYLDRKTSIIKMSITIENLQRGKDILDALAKEYDRADLQEKSIASRNTMRFIDDRLSLISSELSGVEGSLETYQGRNQITNPEGQSAEAFGGSSATAQEIGEIDVQKEVIQQLQNYFNNPGSSGKLVPSSLGITDPTLGILIARYNELELIRQRQRPLLGSSSILLKDYDNQINDIKGSILESLQNLNKNLSLQQRNLQQKNSQYREFLSSLPRKERVIQEIKRKQSITEGLYLYLLQKREEASISAGSENLSIYKQIDKATGFGPVEPNSKNTMMMSVIMGLLMPVGLILLMDQLNDKITTRYEITNKLTIPVLGELVHIPHRKTKGILVMNRDLFGEQFRLIRTNLALADRGNNNQVILVTSSNISEGKSMVCLNLAAVLAAPGKKVALLEFDMRKPGISKNLGIVNNKGLSDYLSGQTIDLSEIYHISEDLPTLHIYPAGPIPPNPADLLMNENMAPLFEVLRRRYDYVIIDTAPSGLVTDAFILSTYTDTSIYIIRQRQTLKKQLDFINDIISNNRLKNLGLVINDVKTGGKYGSGYGYGENYNYVYGQESKKRWWQRIGRSSSRA
ncbi:MAG: polysaccharide biosynthesis tyrosine autokinase [Ferruginibacter sp.]|nr:polysaccharide biosynthesis tyrosine autokinase [Ferruginibacter sp.]